MMQTIIRIFIACFGAYFLSGCAKSEVTVFHQLDNTLQPKTYVFFPTEDQKNSLEYKTYQNLIKQQLSNYNFTEATSNEIPDVVISFGYGIDNGREKLASVPIYGQTGVSSSTTYGTLNNYGQFGTYSGTTTYTPSYGVVGTSTYSKTEYERGMWLFMVDAKSIGSGTENLKILYEATIKSSGSSSQLSRIMPAMIQALFEEFPGESGKARIETIALD
ncbi:DUF4136 domain-containing protein [Photobacterium sp. Hal280]|uniref:DUF4136 domain-containing protein n=1 Tax=Photobacterium sp. Hal280 TaxID=3035163 RepID=UPI00301DB87F